ncbi:hypothetical protein QR680_003855 [Steinernema hermaphroditum]|uniref:Uncharacterized protein n=1 Tax=Steinernema hermaphroditum TaxID=289476 RepID=A0AA39HMV4_9BILA|nr:hypothetical protein QR680_003855 [Steinernema hermaphroditum]
MKILFVVLLILGFALVNSAPVVDEIASSPENMLIRFHPEDRDAETSSNEKSDVHLDAILKRTFDTDATVKDADGPNPDAVKCWTADCRPNFLRFG